MTIDQTTKKEMLGEEFGRWTVEAFDKKVVRRYDHKPGCTTNYWLCRCECGITQSVSQTNLKQGASQGCRHCAAKDRWGAQKQAGLPSWVWHNILTRCKSSGHELAVTPERLVELLEGQGHRCALSGLPISFAPCNRLKNQTTASVDRKDSSGGYVEGNVWWVHKKVNSMKNQYPLDEFLELCEMVTNHNKK